MDYENRIICNPKILLGKPTIKGTRIPVELILRMLAAGVDYAEILEEYPDLTREDILAALGYAKDTVEVEEVRHVEAVV